MVITHAHIKTMENCEYPDGYLQFQNEKILSVGEMAKMPADDEIFDASGKVLLPGFIDSHCHIGMWEDGLGFEGDDGNEETDPITPQPTGFRRCEPAGSLLCRSATSRYYNRRHRSRKCESDRRRMARYENLRQPY